MPRREPLWGAVTPCGRRAVACPPRWAVSTKPIPLHTQVFVPASVSLCPVISQWDKLVGTVTQFGPKSAFLIAYFKAYFFLWYILLYFFIDYIYFFCIVVYPKVFLPPCHPWTIILISCAHPLIFPSLPLPSLLYAIVLSAY